LKLGGTAPARRATKLSPDSVVTGVVFCFMVTLFSAGILAVILLRTPITEKALSPVVNVVGALSVFSGGFVAGRRSGTLGWMHGGIAGLFYSAACFLVGVFAFPELAPVALLVRRLVLGFSIGLLGGVAGVNF